LINAIGLINLNESEEFLREITRHRPVAAIPFGGRYRLIDFVLSNMVNSGIRNVGILIQNKFRSLKDHLRAGKEWDLDRKRDGLFILVPALASSALPLGLGDLETMYSNLDFISKSRQKYVILAGSSMVCNIDYRPAFNAHLERGSDITVLYKELDPGRDDFSRSTVLDIDADGRVRGLAINPVRPESPYLSLATYILAKDMLADLVDAAVSRGASDFVRDVILSNLGRLTVHAFPYTGYLARIHSIQSYYRCSMDLLKPEVWQDLYFRSGFIYTKAKDEAPARYKEAARVANSLVASGCVIEGQVENSILFRAVRIKKGACVKNSIVMQKGDIEEDVRLENVICDKDVRITQGRSLKGEPNYPLVIEKGTVI